MAIEQQQALDVIKDQQKELARDYRGKSSDQFVDEMKNSQLFQSNWGELLAAAPTALSLLGACYTAASNEATSQISLADARPARGFQYLVDRPNMTLRAALVDVCQGGGYAAFKIAGVNMDAIAILSKRITTERIDSVFKRLAGCTKGEYELEVFGATLQDLSDEAKQCATLATEIRVGFSGWVKMVGELKATIEQKSGITASGAEIAKQEEILRMIDEKFAKQRADAATQAVMDANQKLSKTESRLDRALDKIPRPWETLAITAVAGFTQALPSIIAAAVPVALASGPSRNANSTLPKAAEPDGSGAAALQVTPIVTTFYSFLGDDKGTVDWTKFTEAAAGSNVGTPQGVSYILGTLINEKKNIDGITTPGNTKIIGALDKCIAAATAIKENIAKQEQLTSEKVGNTIIAAWKTNVKQAKMDLLQLSSAATADGSTNAPNPFANVKVDVPETDLSAQNAQLSSAMQAVQMAEQNVVMTLAKYNVATQKQAQTAAAMAEVENRLKSLRDKGTLLENIKEVLKSCINVLVDLVIQVSRIEQFFTMLSTVIDNIIIARTATFTKEMANVGNRTREQKAIKFGDITKQVVYISTLQVKAYFSLLNDIAMMYSSMHIQYIHNGMKGCEELSVAAAAKRDTEALQIQLNKYMSDSAKAVAALMSQKQKELLDGLKARARKVAEITQAIENTMQDKGLVVDKDAKKAIEQGAEKSKEAAKELLDSTPRATGVNLANF